MKKDNINNDSTMQNSQNQPTNNIMNMLSMLSHKAGDNVMQSQGDAKPNDIVEPSSATPLSKRALRYADMMTAHDAAVRRLKERHDK